MTRQPITRVEWWIGILIVLAALTAHGLWVSHETTKIETLHEPGIKPIAQAF